MATGDIVSKLEVNLNIINADKTTDAADGIAYLFCNSFNNSIDANDIVKLPNISGSYNFSDTKPCKGINYNRVKSTSHTGEISYTGIVNEIFGSDIKNDVTVYSNPLTSNRCLIELHNKPTGKYELKLINSAGITVFATFINTMAENSTQPAILPASLSKDSYQLQIEGAGKKEIIKLIILY